MTLEIVLNYLNRANEVNANDCNVYFSRALVLLFLKRFEDSAEDIEKAIDKSDDNFANYYFLRGLVHYARGMFRESNQDLSIALNLDKEKNLYLYYRAISAL
jgi:tetratricopeptide (TPR) repeat protein